MFDEQASTLGALLETLGAILLVGDWNAGGAPTAYISQFSENWEHLALGLTVGTYEFAELMGMQRANITSRINLDAKAASALADNLWIRFHEAASQSHTVCVGTVLDPEAREGYVKVVIRDQSGEILDQTCSFIGLEADEVKHDVAQNQDTIARYVIESIHETLVGFVNAVLSDNQE